MHKEDHFATLAAHLAAIGEPKRSEILDYYREMVCDQMEDGRSEEEVLAALGDPEELARKIVAEAELLAVAQPETPPAGDEGRLYPATAPARSVRVLAKDTKVLVERVADGPVRVLFEPRDYDRVEVEERDGVFTFRQSVRGIHVLVLGDLFSSPRRVILQLPADFTGDVEVTTSNARIAARDLGELGNVTIATSNARLSLSGLRCGALVLKTSNGSMDLADARGTSCAMTTSNSRLTASGVRFPVRLELRTSNGSIAVEDGGSDDVRLTTSNSGIRATLAGDVRAYSIHSYTSNGKNNLPPDWPCPGSDKRLNVTTSNAKIDVTFAPEGE